MITSYTIAIISVLFLLGYFFITVEDRYNLHKAQTAAFLGTLLWVIIVFKEGRGVDPVLIALSSDIFSLVMFLLVAMTLVEILVHYRFFDYIKVKLLRLGLGYIKRFWVIGIITFFLSSIIDNMTATLVMLAIAMCLSKGKNLSITAAAIVIAANAGGAWTPIGDVTTLMIWIAEKYTAWEVMLWGFLPSVALFVISLYLLSRKMEPEAALIIDEAEIILSRSEWCVIFMALLSFAFPLISHEIGLPPCFGLLLGFGATGVLISIFRNYDERKNGIPFIHESSEMCPCRMSGDSHFTTDLKAALAKTDVAALVFFTGILLAVGALNHVGILAWLSNFLLGTEPTITSLFFGTGFLGLLSSLVDNIPLTAAALSIIKVTDPAIWSLLALTVGTGGSILIIGSAAGVVAMGKVKDLTFYNYAKIASIPGLIGYASCMFVWLLEYHLAPVLIPMIH